MGVTDMTAPPNLFRRSFFPTFLQFHGEELQFLHPLLQLVLGRRGHRIHLLIPPVVILIGVSVEHLEEKHKQLGH